MNNLTSNLFELEHGQSVFVWDLFTCQLTQQGAWMRPWSCDQPSMPTPAWMDDQMESVPTHIGQVASLSLGWHIHVDNRGSWSKLERSYAGTGSTLPRRLGNQTRNSANHYWTILCCPGHDQQMNQMQCHNDSEKWTSCKVPLFLHILTSSDSWRSPGGTFSLL